MPKDPNAFPVFVIGNKVDLPAERAVSEEAVQAYLARNTDIMYRETSALTGINVKICFSAWPKGT